MNTDMNKKTRQVASIYIGPTIIKYGLFPNKVFKCGIPYGYPPFKDLFSKCMLFKNLFVEPKMLGIAKKHIKSKGTLEYQAVIELIEYVKKEENK